MWKVTFHEMQKMQKSCDHRLTKMEQDDDDEDYDDEEMCQNTMSNVISELPCFDPAL